MENCNIDSNLKIGIIGAGFMGSSIAKGLKKSFPNNKIYITDADKNKVAGLKEIGLESTDTNSALINECNVIFLAVKPNIIPLVLGEIAPLCTIDKLIISIAAGVTLKTIGDVLKTSPIIRVMPNICASVLEGVLAYAPGKLTTPQLKETAHSLLSAIGIAFQVEEKLLDAVTGLSGSGAAFIFMAIEALSDGGVLCGLPRDISNKLAAQTVYGASKMYLESDTHAGALKDMVTSPGGTTIQGVKALEKNNFRYSLIEAVEKATEQSKKFSNK